MSRNGHDDIAARLRDEASATAPERLRADVMLRIRAEPRPQRIRPRRSFGRSFATLAAAACILGALVFGATRVDFGGTTSSSSGGGTAAAERAGATLGPQRADGALKAVPHAPSAGNDHSYGVPSSAQALNRAPRLTVVPRPLRAAIYGRSQLVSPLRNTFGALDPYHLRQPR